MSGVLSSGVSKPGSGDIEGVTAGVGISGGGTSGTVTVTLDLSELSAVTPANGDSLSTIDSDGANEQLTTVAALATLFAGVGLSASSAVLTLDLSELSAVTPANGDSLATIDSDGGTEQLTTVAALATLFAGTGLAASSSVLSIDFSELSAVTPANGDSLATLDSDGGTEQLTTVAALATLLAGDSLTASSSVIGVDDSTASVKGAVIVAGGTDATVSYSSGTATVAVDDSFIKNDANDTTSGIITAAGLTLADAANVNISTPLLAGADHTTTGMTAQMLAGGAISAFDLVCIHTTTQEVVEADASAYATARVIGIAPAAISDTATGTILLHGFIRDDSWGWTTGATLYLSETAGALTETAPTTDGAFVQAVGIALEPDVVYINPSMDVIEHA